MFNKTNGNNKISRFNSPFNYSGKDSYEELIYEVLQQFDLETINAPAKAPYIDFQTITKQEFIDELFILLRTVYEAKVSVDEQNALEVAFSEQCKFKLNIA